MIQIIRRGISTKITLIQLFYRQRDIQRLMNSIIKKTFALQPNVQGALSR